MAIKPSNAGKHIFYYAGSTWLTQYGLEKYCKRYIVCFGLNFGATVVNEDKGWIGALSVVEWKLGFSMRGGCGIEPGIWNSSPIYSMKSDIWMRMYYPGKSLSNSTRKQVLNRNRFLSSTSATLNWQYFGQSLFDHKQLVRKDLLNYKLGDKQIKNGEVKKLNAPLSMSMS